MMWIILRIKSNEDKFQYIIHLIFTTEKNWPENTYGNKEIPFKASIKTLLKNGFKFVYMIF